MKKVLFVATVTEHINAFHIPYLKWCKEQGYEVHVASNGDKKIQYCDQHYHLSFERSPLQSANLKAYKDLKKIINQNKYVMIHCHTPVGGALTRMASKRARKKDHTKVIYTAHGFHFYKGAPLLNWLLYYPLERILAKYTDTLITINQEDYDRAKKFKAGRVELVHGVGVDKEKFDFIMTDVEKMSYKQSMGIKEKDFVITIIGELNKNKNQIMAIESMKNLVKKQDSIKLLLVGEGILQKEYQDKIKEYGLQNDILMLGYRSDVPKILKISNLLLSLSYREGLPVNVIEAMMNGLPIIATNCRGNRELVQDGKNGYIIEPKEESLSEKIMELIVNEEKRMEYAEFNYKIMDRYTSKSIINKMKEIYEFDLEGK